MREYLAPVFNGFTWYQGLCRRSVLGFLCFAFFLFFENGLRRREPRYANAKWRRAHVIHAYTVAELHALGVATMFSTYSNFQFRPGLSPALNSPFHQHPHASFINCLKWI